MTQRDRMLAGQLYNASDADLVRRRACARDLTARYNASANGSSFQPDAADLRAGILRELLGRCGEKVTIEPPFHCDYGKTSKWATTFTSTSTA